MKKNLFVSISRILIVALLLAAVLFPGIAAQADTQIRVRIEGQATTYADKAVAVSGCTVTDTAGVQHTLGPVALCAVTSVLGETGVGFEIQDFGFGLFLKKIGSDDTPSDFSKSWSFWVNGASASVGTDTYTPAANDDILLGFSAYPGMPLRISGPGSAQTGQSFSLKVEKLVTTFDANFNLSESWQPASGATVYMDGSQFTVADSGTATASMATAGTYVAYAKKDGAIISNRISVTITNPVATPTPTPSITPTPSPTATPTPSASTTPTPTPTATATPTPVAQVSDEGRHDAARRALAYLKSKQQKSGDIDGAIVSGWAAMAFGANSERAAGIEAGGDSLLTALTRTSFSSATDVERLMMAVRAAGVNPRQFAGQDLVTILKGKFSNGQIGEEGLINDDIFGVLALLAGDENVNSREIEGAVATILSKQSDSGAWENIDMTAAAIQALRAYTTRGGNQSVTSAMSRARGYLKSNQDEHGGFGKNSATTAWGIGAIVSLGENPTDWTTSSGKHPFSALLRYQNSNGGFGWQGDADPSPFMTAYAIPALLKKSWPIMNLSMESAVTQAATSPTPTPTASPAAGRVLAATKTSAVPAAPPTATPSALLKKTTPALSEALPATEALEPSPQPSPTFTPAPGFVPLDPIDQNFTVTLFSLANMGLGITMTRLLSKLFFF